MELNEKLIDIKENPVKYIKGIAMDLIVVLVALAYVFYNMVKLEPQNINPLVLIAQSIVSIICGVVIKQSLGENGFSKGYNSKKWQDEEELYNKVCNSAIPYVERVENFYLCEEIEKRRNYRRQHLQSKRMKYDNWFDFEGNYIGTKEQYDKLTFSQKRCLNKCIRVKIYVLNLFSEYGTSTEQDTKKEITDKVQRGKNITKNTLSATIIAIIGVYFVPVLTMNWASFIASTMQVLLWVMFGVLQLYKNYSFIVIDKVSILKTKKELIKKFTSGCEQGMYIQNPYDVQKQVEQTPTPMVS